MLEDFEIPSFLQKVRKQGASYVITISPRVVKYLGLKEGNLVKVYTKKVNDEKRKQ